jgi:hypothetical protein
VNLSSFANAANIPFGMLRVVTGITTTVVAGAFGVPEAEVEVADGVGGAIWLKRYLGGFWWLYACKNNSPGSMCSYMDAVGCIEEFFWSSWVPSDAEFTQGS